jgi:hypothetical protein
MNMRERLPRRYDATVKFFKHTLANEKISHRVRLQAAMRLSDILLEHDRTINRKELAQERAAARQGEPQEPAEPEQEHHPLSPEQAEREAIAFLERSKRKEPNTDVQ